MKDPRFAALALVECSAVSVVDLWVKYFPRVGTLILLSSKPTFMVF